MKKTFAQSQQKIHQIQKFQLFQMKFPALKIPTHSRKKSINTKI